MDALIRDVHNYLFLILVITVLFLLSSCDTDFLKKSAQEATGGVGAGLSEYQVYNPYHKGKRSENPPTGMVWMG